MKYINDKIIVVAIVGASGIGKYTFANQLIQVDKRKNKEQADWRLVTSCTTRKMRVGETQCKEHIFLDEMPKYKEKEIFTHSVYNGADYWTTQLMIRQCKKNICIMDEQSLIKLQEESARLKAHKAAHPIPDEYDHDWPWEFEVISVWVDGLSARVKGVFPTIEYDIVVENTGSIGELYQKAVDVYKIINSKAKKYLK